MENEKKNQAANITGYDRDACKDCSCATCYQKEFCDRCSQCRNLSKKKGYCPRYEGAYNY